MKTITSAQTGVLKFTMHQLHRKLASNTGVARHKRVVENYNGLILDEACVRRSTKRTEDRKGQRRCRGRDCFWVSLLDGKRRSRWLLGLKTKPKRHCFGCDFFNSMTNTVLFSAPKKRILKRHYLGCGIFIFLLKEGKNKESYWLPLKPGWHILHNHSYVWAPRLDN